MPRCVRGRKNNPRLPTLNPEEQEREGYMRGKRRPFDYRIVVRYSEEDEGYIAVVPELRGCSAWGETEQKALEAVKEAASVWLETAKANNIEIPVPLDKQPVSGR